MKKIIIGISLILLLFLVFLVYQSKIQPKNQANQNDFGDNLEIISTIPSPLDEAVIFPTQIIEIKFNKIISVSEFKHKFDPELEHEVTSNDEKSGTVFKIKFNKPLDLGSGYTLYVLPGTNSVDKKNLGKDIIYHFSTIKYKGV